VQAKDNRVRIFRKHPAFGVTANQENRYGFEQAPAAAHFFGRHLGYLGKGPRNYLVQNTGNPVKRRGICGAVAKEKQIDAERNDVSFRNTPA